MATYDRLDWHFDSAIAAGQPPENAFTHIGFYLAWIIRHDLHNPKVFPASHVVAVKQGEMTGSDLADDIDTKLLPADMNAEGRAFSDARYSAYVDEYGRVFADEPDYSVGDDPASYARIAPALDRLYADWVADGRPKPPPEPESDEPTPWQANASFAPPREMSLEEIERVTAEIAAELGATVGRPPTPEQMPHEAPDLEALIPTDLTSPPMDVSSVSATHWGSSLVNRALKRLDTRPRDAVVVTAMGGTGPGVLTVSLYGVPGVTAERLDAEFGTAIYLPSRGKWQQREIAGRTVKWASGHEFTVAFWSRDALVVHVAGEADAVEAAIAKLP